MTTTGIPFVTINGPMRPSPLHPESPLFLIILSALMAFTSLSTDIYLPALPAMEAAIHDDEEHTNTV